MKSTLWKLTKWATITGLPFLGIYLLGESIGWLTLAGILAALVIFVVWIWSARKKQRRAELMDKYGDENLVNDLMNRVFWQGQTAEQLLDSLGEPLDVDQKILKTKKKEVWKYNHQGGNRYGLKITLDDDQVVGWDHKN